MNDDILSIVSRLEDILQNLSNQPLDQVGSYVVGATIVRPDYDYYRDNYPLLDEIAELGAELETLAGNPDEELVYSQIKSKLASIQRQIHTSSDPSN